MTILSKLAQELQLSRVTISAALRGSPGPKRATRERILRCAERRGYLSGAKVDSLLRMIGILRIKGAGPRGRAAVERQRAIVRSARNAAFMFGYGVEERVVEADDLAQPDALKGMARYCGLLLLPLPSSDLVRRAWQPALPCVYADIPADDLAVDAVCPDYHQSIFLAFSQLRARGIRRPGLLLDNNVPLPARERLISAYSLAMSNGINVIPPPFFMPTPSLYTFGSWLERYSFDALLTTDTDYAKRINLEFLLPLFGLHAGAMKMEPGINLNLSAVGYHAVEMLHARISRPNRSSLPSRLLITASWTEPEEELSVGGTSTLPEPGEDVPHLVA